MVWDGEGQWEVRLELVHQLRCNLCLFPYQPLTVDDRLLVFAKVIARRLIHADVDAILAFWTETHEPTFINILKEHARMLRAAMRGECAV